VPDPTPSLASDDQAILAALRDHGPLSRAALAASTGLSAAAVHRAVARLGAAQFVVPAGHAASTGGRPAELLAYNGVGLLVAGVSVTEDGAAGLVVTLDGEPVDRHTVAFDPHATPEARLGGTLDLLDRLTASEPAPRAIGVAVPGAVGPDGVVTAIHELGWDRLALSELLASRTTLPIVLDNDANCLAIAESTRGAGQGADHLVALVVRSGLGAGLIANGRLLRGVHHEAGEIGYLLTARDSLRRLFPGRGDLEQQIGGPRLAARARDLGFADTPTLPRLIAHGLATTGPARDLADELLDLTALAVSALCVVLDPEVVILSGTHEPGVMTPLITGLTERLLGRILRVPRIEPPALGADAIMIGAARLAAETLTR
jgi:predicted NBD/HSP70 family sugar kinase